MPTLSSGIPKPNTSSAQKLTTCVWTIPCLKASACAATRATFFRAAKSSLKMESSSAKLDAATTCAAPPAAEPGNERRSDDARRLALQRRPRRRTAGETHLGHLQLRVALGRHERLHPHLHARVRP